MLPFDSEHLTEPERALQRLQEKRDCRTCRRVNYNPRSGAITCTANEMREVPSMIDVQAGHVDCWCYVPC